MKTLDPQEKEAADAAEEDRRINMGVHKGEFCFQTDCTFNCLDGEGNDIERQFLGGKYYWIEQVTNYADGYSDIKFDDDTVLYQIQLNEIGFILGRPKQIYSEEIIPEQESTETKNVDE